MNVRVVSALTNIFVKLHSETEYSYIYNCLSGFDEETTWTQIENTVTIKLLGYTVVGTISGNTMTVVIPDF